MSAEKPETPAGGDARSALPNGETGVRVTLQYRPRFTEQTRQERHEILHDHFQQVAQRLEPHGGEVDLSSLSVLGQTVEAVLPAATYDDVVAELEASDVRVDPLATRSKLAT